MKRWKKILHKLLFPGKAVVLLSVPLAAALLAYTFLRAGEDSPAAYVSYVISAYSLTVVCASVSGAVKKGSQWASGNRYISRYRNDLPFKLSFSLHISLVINLFYAAVNAVSGIYYRSAWFVSLAVYYIVLSVMRFTLAKYVHSRGFGEDREAEWRRSRLCGILLIVMNVVLVGVIVLVVSKDQAFHYGGFLIYVMAMYAFYTVTMAVVNIVRYRKSASPAMSAVLAVSLASALVSMLSLETAMVTQFSAGDEGPFFRKAMTAATGGAVCALIVGTGILMIVRSTKALRKEKSEGKEQDGKG